MIHRVQSGLVADLWAGVEKYVAAAMDFHPFLDAGDVRLLLLNGLAQLFIVTGGGRSIDGFAVTEVTQYPRCRVANILACGGVEGFADRAVHQLLPVLRKWAFEQNASKLAIMGGRTGWMRLLRDEGGTAEKYILWWEACQ